MHAPTNSAKNKIHSQNTNFRITCALTSFKQEVYALSFTASSHNKALKTNIF